MFDFTIIYIRVKSLVCVLVSKAGDMSHDSNVNQGLWSVICVKI